MRFEEYISELPDDARQGISDSLNGHGIKTHLNNVGLHCADLLELVLRTLVSDDVINTPLNNLPHKKNPYFTGREEKLLKIQDNFKNKDMVSLTQSVTGLGGIGKSSIALEYAYSNFKKYETIWWVNAETEQTALTSVREFALKKKIITAEANASEIAEALKYWFMNRKNKNWLFVYDNADAENFDWLEKYLPQTNNGHALITTRSHFFPQGTAINIDIFSETEAIAFLKKRTKKHGEGYSDKLAKDLAVRLQYLPLALEQSAAYIEQTQDVTYQDYIALIEKHSVDVFAEKRYIVDYVSTVAITWKISMEKITHASAVQLFNMCAYFASIKIPVDIFIKGNEELPTELKSDIMDDFKRNDILRDLTRYSLLSCENDDAILSDENRVLYMHRLLQEVVQKSISADIKWLEYCLYVFATAIRWKKGDKDAVDLFKAEYPHAITIAETAVLVCSENEEAIKIAGMMLNAVGQLLSDVGDPNGALRYFSKGLEICVKIHGGEHIETATAYNNVGYVYRDLDQANAALEHYKKALGILKNTHGDEHPHVAASYNNIGYVYSTLSEIKTALDYYDKALAIHEKINGKGHPDTVTLLNNIGTIYARTGKVDKALEYYYQGLKIREVAYGVEHPYTAMSYNNIGVIYADSGKPQKAVEYYDKALMAFEKIYGEDNIKVAVLYNNIGDVYRVLTEFDKALEYYMKSLKINETVYGETHLSTATLYNNVAAVFACQKDYDKSLAYHKKALQIRIDNAGERNSDTAASYLNIGEVYRGLGQTDNALSYFDKALSIFERIYGKDLLFTATVYNNIAAVYADTEKPEKALEYFNKALVILKNQYGEEQIYTATTYDNIGLIHVTLGENKKAFEYFKKSLIIREKLHGKENSPYGAMRELFEYYKDAVQNEGEENEF
jgi:tetratricopeptide (TPR) repeat protein